MSTNRALLSTNPIPYIGKDCYMVLVFTGAVSIPLHLYIHSAATLVVAVLYAMLFAAMMAIKVRGSRDDLLNTTLHLTGILAGLTGMFISLAVLLK